jgi:hypothetical protein
MYLTNLADVLRGAGLKVVEVPGWKTRGYRRLVGDTYRADLLGVESIIVHHTATSWNATGDYPTLATVRDGRSDVAGPLSQLGLGRNGTWYVIAAGYANHTGKTLQPWQSNSYALGIEAEASGVGDPRDWPKVQMDSYAKGVKALATRYGVPVERVLGHKEIASPLGRKTDPSFDMGAFRSKVRSVDLNTGGFLMALNDEKQDEVLEKIQEIFKATTTRVTDVASSEGLSHAAALRRILVITRRSEQRENRLLAAVEVLSAHLGEGQAEILAALNEALAAVAELDEDLPEGPETL